MFGTVSIVQLKVSPSRSFIVILQVSVNIISLLLELLLGDGFENIGEVLGGREG